MAGVHLLNSTLNYQLLYLGVLPREPESLPFIPLMPFLHGSVVHLANNFAGLLIFGGLLIVRSRKLFVRGSIFIVLVSGLLVWLFGRSNIHVGASGWIFGLWSLLIALAFYTRRFVDLLIALFVIVFYGGMVYGVLPGDPLVSFESHLFGAVSGVVYVALPGKRGSRLS
ncbi:rhomboid family intramembrane serine protease [Proteobacteria bacterium 005FR1]|nr:rhomboid family intramembrane serine protease [Proteobacteria bacterium 005FR1]